MNPVIVVSVLIVTISLALVLWHVVEWRALENGEPDDRERQFAWKRFRRRSQASGMIGVVGVLIFASNWLFAENKAADPWIAVCYWGGILLLLVWVMLLAVGDAISSRNFFRAEHRRQVADQVRFQTEIIRKGSRASLPASDGGEGAK